MTAPLVIVGNKQRQQIINFAQLDLQVAIHIVLTNCEGISLKVKSKEAVKTT